MFVSREIQILIVDDYRNMRSLVRNYLHEYDFKNLDFADDGAAALQKIERTKYDLILADWNMETMDGLEMLKQIRANSEETIRELPVIMITVEAKRPKLLQLLQAGANDYLNKPFRAEELIQKIEDIFQELESPSPNDSNDIE